MVELTRCGTLLPMEVTTESTMLHHPMEQTGVSTTTQHLQTQTLPQPMEQSQEVQVVVETTPISNHQQ
ncbi:MAG: hypothetical protein BWY29_01035 [Microgenomates group bacterium ADurb.Bin238]|nr:MAG: hypothetical protein BWY29_01035 [Microgenomates group bacterium ADurb.Bin238]